VSRFARLRRIRQALNGPLLIGGLLVALLLVCAVAAPWISPFDPVEPLVIFNGGRTVRAPYPPGAYGMPLGSDTLRRDMLSRVIFGSRYTLLFGVVTAGARVLLGALLGAVGAWFWRWRAPVDLAVRVSSAIPALVFALLPLGLIQRFGSITLSALGFAVVLSLTGWAETSVRVRLAVEHLRRQPFVEAAYALGLRDGAVLWRHIGPNLRDLLLIEAAYATASVLLLIAELGFLGVYIAGAETEGIGSSLTVDPLFAEWGGMLARGVRDESAGLWLLLVPAGAFVLAILAFNLLADGLRRRG
jgi:ABC-type dipeptide/oligopeptide/nickel transport system permease subunit